MNTENKFEWTDELVAEYSLASQHLTLFEFKRQKTKATSLIEKDYEILSVLWMFNHPDIEDKIIEKINERFRIKLLKEIFFTDEQILGNKCIKINSVRRLNDNIIFSIGDKEKYIGKIESIIFDEKYPLPNDLILHGENGKILCLRYAEKVVEPIPLFTTVDLKSIYEGDRFYTITDDFKIVFSDAVKGIHLTPEIKLRSFKSLEKAEQNILFNQKSLSLNDLLSVWDITRDKTLEKDKEYYKEAPLFKKFEKLAKEKIDSSNK